MSDEQVTRAGVVLIVDDDLAYCESLREVLQLAGHHVFSVGDGVQALEILSEHDVDVLLLDMNMPICDGWTVLSRLDEVLYRPTVIINSSEEFSPEETRELFEAHPFGFLRKPTPPAYVLAVVDSAIAHLRLLGDVRSHAADERDLVAEARDVFAENRDRMADRRDFAADQRDRVADERDRVADRRDASMAEHDQVADKRDRVADERDRVADERDRVADERDRVADERDRVADERDRVADERDRADGRDEK